MPPRPVGAPVSRPSRRQDSRETHQETHHRRQSLFFTPESPHRDSGTPFISCCPTRTTRSAAADERWGRIGTDPAARIRHRPGAITVCMAVSRRRQQAASPHNLHHLHDPSPATGSGASVAPESVRGVASRHHERRTNAAPALLGSRRRCTRRGRSQSPPAAESVLCPPDRRARHHAARLHGCNPSPAWPSACIVPRVEPYLSLMHDFLIHPEPHRG